MLVQQGLLETSNGGIRWFSLELWFSAQDMLLRSVPSLLLLAFVVALRRGAHWALRHTLSGCCHRRPLPCGCRDKAHCWWGAPAWCIMLYKGRVPSPVVLIRVGRAHCHGGLDSFSWCLLVGLEGEAQRWALLFGGGGASPWQLHCLDRRATSGGPCGCARL